MKIRELKCVKCIENEDQWVLVKEEEIKEKWKSYFDKLFNGSHTRSWSELCNSIRDRNVCSEKKRMSEVKDTLRKIKRGKIVGSDEIPIKVWKCFGDVGIEWLTTCLVRS
jgi:hypothetical protein